MDKTSKWLKKASSKFQAGDYATARTFFKKILKLDSNHIDANYLLGALYAEQGNISKALQHTLKAEQLSGQSPFIKNNLGNLYRMQGDDAKAEHYFRQALSIKPDMVEALNNLAILFRRQNLTDNAIELYQSAIKTNPNFIAAHYNLGKAYVDLGQFDDAASCFIRILSMDPNHALSHNEMGNYYMQQNNTDKALSHFNKYLRNSDEDACGVTLKIAYLTAGEIPDKHPSKLIQQSYEIKARSWDTDINRPNMEFLGPQIITHTLNQHTPLQAERALTVLDLGCGTGLCGIYLKPFASRLDGVDLSDDMLKVAATKSLYDQLIHSEAETYLSQNKTHYDLIVASGVLIFFGKLDGIINQISLALTPGGYFIFTTYKSLADDVEIRTNLHFSHSAQHIRSAAIKSQLQVVALEDVVHEYDAGAPQRGFAVCLRKPETPLDKAEQT